jgi:hypothetical protein
MKTIAWIHADNLNPHQIALTLEDDIPAIFVWDDELLAEWEISFKRIVFIYESLLTLPVVIRKGDVAEEVAKFAQSHQAERILTPNSPSPRHRLLCQRISEKMPSGTRLEVLRDDQPFVNYDNDQLDLKRFSRYWRTVKKDALRPTRS